MTLRLRDLIDIYPNNNLKRDKGKRGNMNFRWFALWFTLHVKA